MANPTMRSVMEGLNAVISSDAKSILGTLIPSNPVEVAFPVNESLNRITIKFTTMLEKNGDEFVESEEQFRTFERALQTRLTLVPVGLDTALKSEYATLVTALRKLYTGEDNAREWKRKNVGLGKKYFVAPAFTRQGEWLAAVNAYLATAKIKEAKYKETAIPNPKQDGKFLQSEVGNIYKQTNGLPDTNLETYITLLLTNVENETTKTAVRKFFENPPAQLSYFKSVWKLRVTDKAGPQPAPEQPDESSLGVPVTPVVRQKATNLFDPLKKREELLALLKELVNNTTDDFTQIAIKNARAINAVKCILAADAHQEVVFLFKKEEEVERELKTKHGEMLQNAARDIMNDPLVSSEARAMMKPFQDAFVAQIMNNEFFNHYTTLEHNSNAVQRLILDGLKHKGISTNITAKDVYMPVEASTAACVNSIQAMVESQKNVHQNIASQMSSLKEEQARLVLAFGQADYRTLENTYTEGSNRKEFEAALKKLDDGDALYEALKDVLYDKDLVKWMLNGDDIDTAYVNSIGLKLNAIIMGNAGSGKTTAAKDYAKLLADLQLIPKIEGKPAFRAVNVADVHGGYMGQTALKTRAVLNNLVDGVIFLDEAYAMTEGGNGSEASYADEFNGVLIEMMQRRPLLSIVVAAGYEDRMMKDFLGSNAGHPRRFQTRVVLHLDGPKLREMVVKVVAKKFGAREVDVRKDLSFLDNVTDDRVAQYFPYLLGSVSEKARAYWKMHEGNEVPNYEALFNEGAPPAAKGSIAQQIQDQNELLRGPALYKGVAVLDMHKTIDFIKTLEKKTE